MRKTNIETSNPPRDLEVKLKTFIDDVLVVENRRIAVSPKTPSSPHKESSIDWNSWISVSVITILIAVLVMLELHIRRLIDHSLPPR